MADKGITVDEKFLQDFIAKGGNAETPTGNPVNADNVDKFLADYTDSSAKTTPTKKPTPVTTEDRIEEQRVKQQDREKARSDEAAQKAEEQRLAQQKQAAKTLSGSASNFIDNTVVAPGRKAADWISSLKTVGGVGLLLVILFVLLFTVVQVNAQGDTRMKMLWYMLLGRANLQGRVSPEPPKQQSTAQIETTIATSTSQLVGDVSTVIATAATSALTGSPDFYGGVFTGIAESIGFRNIP